MFRNKMKRSQFKNLFLMLIILLALSVTENEARGGRRGGSFGGVFGSWRKYKKPSSGGGSSRRTTNGSPVHTSVTKMISQTGSSHSGSHGTRHMENKKPHLSYPRQEGVNYNHNSGHIQFHTPNGRTDYHLPAGSTYHANQAAIPVGAVYYAQPPRHSSTGDLIFDAMAAHAYTRAVLGHHGHHHHYHHHHHHNQQNNETAAEHHNRVIIINNESSPSSTTNEHLWPTDGEVPLAPFNNSVALDVRSNADSVFHHKQEMPQPNMFSTVIPATGQLPAQTPTNEFAAPNTQETQNQVPQQNAEQVPTQDQLPPGGIICIPMEIPETDPNDPAKTINVLKTVCFPAPPVPTEEHHSHRRRCEMRTVTEPDPQDPTKTIEVEKEVCLVRRRKTTTQPPQVAGDIDENANTTRAPTLELTTYPLPMVPITTQLSPVN